MSEQLFLTGGSLEGVRESGSFGRPLHTLYPQFRAILERELGPGDALLFAEPVVDKERNLIDWYSQGTAKPLALSTLPESQRPAVHECLVAAYDRIAALADRYLNSGDAGKVQLGAALKAALVAPADANVFLVDGRPVVAFWGFFQDRDSGGPIALAHWRHRYRQHAQAEPEPKPAPAPAEAFSPPRSEPGQAPMVFGPPQPLPNDASAPGYYLVVGSRFFWSVFITSVLLLVLVLLLYGFGILPVSAGRMTDSGRSVASSQAGDEALLRLQGEEADLRARLESLRAAAASRRGQCIAGQPEQAQPLPQPSSETTGLGESSPVAASPEETRQFAERLAREGAASGEITVSLLWNNRNDLDLVVICPSGKLLYYNNPSECGGTLDIDKNVHDLTEHPVENIYWPAGQAPGGPYRVAVKYYARRDSGIAPETSFQVRLVKDGKTSFFKGTAIPEEMKPVTQFSIER